MYKGINIEDMLNLSDTEINRAICNEFFGLIACDKWAEINFGSAGGAALQKLCKHSEGKCYPSMEVGNINGKVGGIPEYSTNINRAKEVLEELRIRDWTITIYVETDEHTGKGVYSIDMYKGDGMISDSETYLRTKIDNIDMFTDSLEKAICLAALRSISY